MTEGYQPPTSRKNTPEQDTATLPRVNVPPAGSTGSSGAANAAGSGSSPGGGWSQASRTTSGAGNFQPSYRGSGKADATENSGGGIGSRLSAAAATVAASATTAASNAKNSIRQPSGEAATASGRPSGRQARNARQPRRARLTLSHVNVYSVFKLSCVLAIALFFVWLIMIGVLYGILDVSGVFDRINQAVHQISGDGKTNNVVSGSLVGGFAIIIGVVYIVLFIALSTIGAMVYNLCADLVGGVEVTLAERE
ncbi:MAG TPA: DUF3566 domain-containing protein [Jatrophihabitans sp.]|nr:DUF3566 domain-containing protein [Jatrophihabitans sp.]